MTMIPIVFALILLHGPDGREIDVSVDEITSLQCKLPKIDNKLFADGVNTVINLTDGRFVSVRETCQQVRDLVEEKMK
jgi:ribosomal protein S4E